ncbi:MAG: hypothetical protein WD030_06765 [Pirellulales bacterium]
MSPALIVPRKRPSADEADAGSLLLAEPIEAVAQRVEQTIDTLERLVGESLVATLPRVSVVCVVDGANELLEPQVAEMRREMPAAQIVLVEEQAHGATREALRRLEEQPNTRVVWRTCRREPFDALSRGADAAEGEVILLLHDPAVGLADCDAVIAPVLKGCCQAMFGVTNTADRRPAGFWRRLLRPGRAGAAPRCTVVRRDLAAQLANAKTSNLYGRSLATRLQGMGASYYEMPLLPSGVGNRSPTNISRRALAPG